MCPCSWTGPRRPGSQLHAEIFPFLHQRAYRPVAGIFRKHCQQVPSRDICKKFFSIPPGVPLPGIRSSCHAPAREEYRPPANVLSLPVRIRQYPLRASSPVSPLSSPLVKQRGAAPPASCRQAPHELRPLPQRQIPQNALPLRQYPSPQHNPRQHQDLIAARPAMEPREGPIRSGMPGYGRRTGAAAPPGTVALGRLTARKFPCTDQNKSFRGDGGTGEGEPFPKGIPSPGRPTFLQ